ncbi:type-F conjugative transfer system secretin TraK [uncultured Tateyamaria sp.]|uniref:TraK domain-containing protein n=1 Tax=uncultured Tateyamaria sp. TaxID=455651 RepID=UPI002613C487|nr:type-F conjugative transfer system secretin TraK [uncultured Tateyamaria sp.]
MTLLPKIILLAGSLLLMAVTASANAQRFNVESDAMVRFRASINGITRISVVGDRISSIVNDNESSVYQVRNDEQTGDLFLRYVGPDELPEKEGGYLVTESGVTVAYEILPKRSSTETILISIKGGAAKAPVADDASDGRLSGDFATTSFGASDSVTGGLVDATRQTIAAKIGSPVPGRGSNGALVATHRMGDLVGEVRVAAAGKAARAVREQDFYRRGVLAVWIARKDLAAGERAWVVVIRSGS